MKPGLFLYCLLCALPLFFIGCQAEPTDTTTTPPVTQPADTTCKLVKTYEYDEDGTIDSALYDYTGSHVTKVEAKDQYYILDYEGNKIVKRSFFDNSDNTRTAYDLIEYNSDSTIKDIYRYDKRQYNPDIPVRLDFSYSNKKLVKISTMYNDGSGQYNQITLDSFIYTGNNITKWIGREYHNGNVTETSSSFAYDNRPNYFQKQSTQTFMLSPDGLDFNAIYIALYLSQNNLIKVSDSGLPIDNINSIVYAEDEHGNLSTLTVDGNLELRCFYQCN